MPVSKNDQMVSRQMQLLSS
jgi:hypothetical protein